MTLNEYLESHTTPVNDTLASVERWAHLHTAQPQMLCGPYEGRLLTMLCRLAQPQCAVEVGTFVGYSTICLAAGLPAGGRLHTFEVNDEYEDVIRRHLEMAGYGASVEVHIGDAHALIPACFPSGERVIDLAFIDAGKRQLRDFYDLLLPRMREGALLLVDNVLWGGKVLEMNRYHDEDTKLIHAFNAYVQQDKRVENMMLGVRDGLLICNVL